jgi:hypothetical protein
MPASILHDFWHDQLVAHDRQGLFLVLVGFLVSFGFIRFSARLGRSPRAEWWPGSVVSDSGVHLHHLVWGICLMLAGGASGFLLFHASPGFEISAVLFGVGAGFTLDEFALWVYLDDVYWAEEGRASIDAAVIAATGMLLVLLGARPFEVGTDTATETIVSSTVALFALVMAAICFAKQRLLHGTVGLFIWPIALYAAVRIGKPGSPWGKRFYGECSPRKQAKAERRFPRERRTERFKERFRDAVGGETDAVYRAKLLEQAAGAEAAAEIRERAERAVH